MRRLIRTNRSSGRLIVVLMHQSAWQLHIDVKQQPMTLMVLAMPRLRRTALLGEYSFLWPTVLEETARPIVAGVASHAQVC